MMKSLAASAAVGALVVTGLGAVIAPAQADTPGCTTLNEFRLVQKSWTKARVDRLFDGYGKVVYQGYGSKTQEYNDCPSRYGWVWIDYSHHDGAWHVTGKHAYWG